MLRERPTKNSQCTIWRRPEGCDDQMFNIRVRRLRNDVLAVFLGVGEIYLMLDHQAGGMLLLEKDRARVHAAMEEDPLQYEPEMERKSSPVMLAECLRYGPRAEKAHQLLHP